MSSPITEKQHYVPRSYLKNFANLIGSGKKEKALVSFYQFEGEILRENIPTKSICYKSYFYGKDGKLEKAFSLKEARWTKVLKDAIEMKSYSYTLEQEQLVKEFAGYQLFRTVAMHNFVKSSIEELFRGHFTNQYNISSNDNTVREIIKTKVDEEIKPSFVIDSCDELISVLKDLQISVIHFETAEHLITSDMPVLVLNPFSISGGALGMIGVFIIIPVSPHVALAIYDEKVYTKCKSYIESTNEQDVINLNKYQILSAEERVIAFGGADLEHAISHYDALEQRNKLRSLRNVDSYYDGFGTFFAIHSRKIPYIFNLSFCTLPKCIRKIPNECRGSYPREYTKEYWERILFQQYRLPDLLINQYNLSRENVAERKYGYSRLRTYLEDYWMMPTAERVITPEMMENIKSRQIGVISFDNRN